MTSILFLMEEIYCNISIFNYLRKKKTFSNFFLHTWNLDSIFNILQKKDDPHSCCIFELTDSEKSG